MAVIIENVDMPTNCATCIFRVPGSNYCKLLDRSYINRKVDCPLRPVPAWINAKESYPKFDHKTIHSFSENVIGYDGYNLRKAYYNFTAGVWLNGNDELEWPEITHWMPMPELPDRAIVQ